MPQLDGEFAGQLAGGFDCLCVVSAFEIDARLDVAVRSDLIQTIVRHVPHPNVRPRHDGTFALDCEAKTSVPQRLQTCTSAHKRDMPVARPATAVREAVLLNLRPAFSGALRSYYRGLQRPYASPAQDAVPALCDLPLEPLAKLVSLELGFWFLLERGYLAIAVPQFDVVAANKVFSLLHGFGIVGAIEWNRAVESPSEPIV
jgi:hypothetical protein